MANIKPAPADTRAGEDEKTEAHHVSAENRIEHSEVVGDGILPMVAKDKVDEFGGHTKVDPKEIGLVKRLDLYMLPILWIMYFFNLLDRNALFNAKLNSLDEDLGLHGTEYNTLVGILNVGYIAGQIPSNMIINRVRPSLYMGGFCVVWSIICTLTFLAQNFEHMLAFRLLLGFAEAPFYPGALYLLSCFYTRKEIATRMAIFYTGNMLAASFSGLIAAAIFSTLDGRYGMAGWRWLYIIQGTFSTAVVVASLFLLPNHPLKTKWLTQEQRELAHNRIVADTTEKEGAASPWKGLYQCVVDWRTWVFVLMYNLHLSSVSFAAFLPTVMRTLGYSTNITLVLTFPPYFLAAILGIVMSWTSGSYNERTWHITVLKCIVMAGFIVAVSTTNIPARFVAIFMFVPFSFGINNIMLGWISATLAQTNEKKAVALAICNSFGNLNGVYTPYLWPDSSSPRFLQGFLSCMAFSAVVIITVWIMKFALKRRNKQILRDDPNAISLYVY
ncbi:unnamed protein product [Clonostachys rosea f. rosea IK726]|uniref:Uncharacterized protein n=1 Tax=Clonostachys rosea f. rosea IK726 TaxID=1349383 RepID=A0ACA9U308_BIOOC|nr:unnamed protein product [Clonostachys rosea f. rosea IK726]